MVYRIMYPENGEDATGITFQTPWDAASYWRNKKGGLWIEFEPQNPLDKKAFMQCATREIVVVRPFDNEGDV
jgi:hypothetical protein